MMVAVKARRAVAPLAWLAVGGGSQNWWTKRTVSEARLILLRVARGG